jgi:hypothetical protein
METAALFVIALLIATYFLPLVIALMRGPHRQTLAIGLLNLLLGWTLVGWVVALVWAVTNPPAPIVIRAEP